MTIQQDFISYHRSIGEVLKNSENRIRNLIGRSHWLTDGEHKESILRKVIADFAPEIFRIGSGFICYPSSSDNSTQIDILVTSKMNPTLYKSGELHFVTPDCANAIIEVKTRLTNGENLTSVILSLSQQVSRIRVSNPDCWAGLFIYEAGRLTDEHVLNTLQTIAANDPLGVINCVAIGKNHFVRYWANGHTQSQLPAEAVWHAYELSGLAQPYFISNLISHLSPNFTESNAEAWFPITESKEVHKTKYAMLAGTEVNNFE